MRPCPQISTCQLQGCCCKTSCGRRTTCLFYASSMRNVQQTKPDIPLDPSGIRDYGRGRVTGSSSSGLLRRARNVAAACQQIMYNFRPKRFKTGQAFGISQDCFIMRWRPHGNGDGLRRGPARMRPSLSKNGFFVLGFNIKTQSLT